MPRAPWERARGVSVALTRWRSDPTLRHDLVLDHTLAPRGGDTVPLPDALSPALRKALASRRIEGLYRHQRDAFTLANDGRHVIVATPTASGKSLCFALPIAHHLTQHPDARALVLLPTKALARDQELSLQTLLRAAGLPSGVSTYDGDTPADARRHARDHASVVVTNPDMLQAGMLPHHTSWSRFFASLRYVVVDELHVYTGVFGSHVANVLRRLRRVARFHGADPVFLCASATIGNPVEHARHLLDDDVVPVLESGAPAGPRHVVVCNPPLLNPELGVRASYTRTAVRLAADLVRAEVPTIVFGQSRNAVETMLRYLRERLSTESVPEHALQAYRGGYLPETRRRIEQGLRDGDVRCVVATSALELGIDIGDLDAVVCAGYPGTLAGTWQRFGRAGRRGEPSLAVMVTSSAPVDQYLALHPRWLLGAPIEEARVDPHNVEILLRHMQCAAFELPFGRGDRYGSLGAEATGDALDFLAQQGSLHRSATRWHWVGAQYPAASVSLRNVGAEAVQVIDTARNATLAELDRRSALLRLHEGAIYQHEGASWRVETLDLEAGRALAVPTDDDYFTEPITQVEVAVLEVVAQATLGSLGPDAIAHGEVNVVTRVPGFKRVRFHTHETIGYGELDLPPIEVQTAACWITVPESVVTEQVARADAQGQPAGRPRVLDGLRGVGHALRTVAGLRLMCAPHDLLSTLGGRHDGALPARDENTGTELSPTVFLYDAAPGGVGLAERLFDCIDSLLCHSLDLIASCPCSDGCPACVGPGIDTGPFGRKAMAVTLLEALGIARPA